MTCPPARASLGPASSARLHPSLPARRGCRGRGAGPRGRARGCVPAVPAVGRLLAQISLREALRGGDGATAAGLAAPHPRCAPRQAGRLGVCPTWDPLDSPEGPGECLRPGRLVLAGVLRSSCSRKRAPLRTSSRLPPLLQMPNPPAGWAAAPAPSSSLLGQWDRAPLHPNSILSPGEGAKGRFPLQEKLGVGEDPPKAGAGGRGIQVPRQDGSQANL